jgi:hypothetical protein
MRIDNGSPITLKVGMINIANPGMIEFAISDDLVNQLLNCNNSIDLEFNTQGDYIRKWHISSETLARRQNHRITYGKSTPPEDGIYLSRYATLEQKI